MAQGQQGQGLTWGKALKGAVTITGIAAAASAVAVLGSDVGFGEVFESFGQEGKGFMAEAGDALGHVGDAFTGAEGKDSVFTNASQFLSGIWEQVTQAFNAVTSGFTDGFATESVNDAAGVNTGAVDKALYSAANLAGSNPIPAAAVAGGAAVGAAVLASKGDKKAKGAHSSRVLRAGAGAQHQSFADRIHAEAAAPRTHQV